MSGIEHLSQGIIEDLGRRLPGQRKTQREKLGLLVATMLDVRSANLMDLAASLPRATGRVDMRYQWIERLLAKRARRCRLGDGALRRSGRGRDFGDGSDSCADDRSDPRPRRATRF